MAKAETVLKMSVYGPDRPGILSVLTRIIAEFEIEIIHIEQASLQGTLNLHLFLNPGENADPRDKVVKELLFQANNLDLILKFQVCGSDLIPKKHGSNLVNISHFGDVRSITEISEILGGERANIETINTEFHHGARCIQMKVNVSETAYVDRLKKRIMKKSRDLGIDLAIQSMDAYKKNKRLICFDMDSTLVDMEGIDEMARKRGVYREVVRITDKAMRGDMDFEASLRQRVAMLKGLSLDEVNEIKEKMILSEGASELLTTLKWLGYKVGIVSGGFEIFAEALKNKFDLDFTHANVLEIKNGVLTGNVTGDIIDGIQKAKIVNELSCEMGIALDQVVAVGDGANDSLMLAQAGLGIAYNAKKGLDRVANASLAKSHFNHIFHLLGIYQEDIDEAMSCGQWA